MADDRDSSRRHRRDPVNSGWLPARQRRQTMTEASLRYHSIPIWATSLSPRGWSRSADRKASRATGVSSKSSIVRSSRTVRRYSASALL